MLFAFDVMLYKDENKNVYSKGLFPYTIWQRYLSCFDEVIVASRMSAIKSDETANLNLSSGKNVSFVEIPSISSLKGQIFTKPLAKKILENEILNCDAVIARIPSDIGNLAVTLAKKLKKPYTVEVVSCPWDSYWNHGSIKGKIYAPISTYITKQITKKSNYTVYVTEKFLQNRYPTKGKSVACSNVELVPQGLDVFNKRKERIVNKKNDKYVIGLIGYLSTNIKGIDTALYNLKLIVEQGHNIQMRILGSGDRSRWIKLAVELGVSENVVFDSPLPAGDPVLSWLDEIDIYVHPSRQEGLPRAVIEAMSRGCPIIASNVGGIPELINNNFLHAPGDYSVMSKLLLKLLNNKEMQLQLSSENFNNSIKYNNKNLNMVRTEFYSKFIHENWMVENK